MSNWCKTLQQLWKYIIKSNWDSYACGTSSMPLFPCWCFGWSAYALSKLSLKFGWNLLSLKTSRSPSKVDDIVAGVAGVYDDYEHSWLGLVSLMTFWMICIWPEEDMFKIWLKSVEFEGIKNGLKHGWHCWRCCWSLGWLWTFLTGAGVLYGVLDGLHMPWVNYV